MEILKIREHKEMADKAAEWFHSKWGVTSFYERYAWKFFCMVQEEGQTEMTRMYIHST